MLLIKEQYLTDTADMVLDKSDKLMKRFSLYSFLFFLLMITTKFLYLKGLLFLSIYSRADQSIFNWFVFVPLLLFSLIFSILSIQKLIKEKKVNVFLLLSIPILVYFIYLLLSLLDKFLKFSQV